MADLTLRSVSQLPPAGSLYTTKNAALTYIEIDNNFIELDAEVHTLSNLLPESGPVAPSPGDGKLWYDTANNALLIWDGTGWAQTSVNQNYAQSFQPVSPRFGNMYFDTTTDELSMYDGANWISVTTFDGSPTGGTSDDF